MRLLALLALVVLALAARAQTILFASETASPGSTLFVVGDGLAGATFRLQGSAPGSLATLAPAAAPASEGRVAYVTMPASLPMGAYRLTASAGGKGGNAVYVNRPREQWLDVDAAMPGQAVRAVGRNLSVAGRRPAVTLVSLATRARVAAIVERAAATDLRFRVPSGAPPGLYKVQVDNGLGGLAATGAIALPLTVSPARPDPLSLGVAWGADVPAAVYDARSYAGFGARPAGDGVAEDGAAIAAELAAVAARGGGTLLLPAGDYRIDRADGSDWLQVRSGVVLRGAGIGRTRLLVGYGASASTPSYHCALTLWAGDNALPEGLCDLSVVNLNPLPDGASPSNLLNVYGGGAARRVVLERVAFEMGNGQGINLSPVRQAVIDGCSWRATSLHAATLALQNAQEVRYAGNVDYHRGGRMRVQASDRVVIEGSRVEWDNAYTSATSPETGGMDLSLDSRVLVSNNDVGGQGPQALAHDPNNDSECILAQFVDSGALLYTGMATGGTARTLASAAALPAGSWEDAGQPSPSPQERLAIVAGRGMGQVRGIVSHSGTLVTVDEPWLVVPDATSRFAIAPSEADRYAIEGNRTYGGHCGIQLSDGALDSSVVDNRLSDTGFLGVFAYAKSKARPDGSNALIELSWNVQVLRNRVTGGVGRRHSTVTTIGEDLTASDYGPLALGVDVRGNAVSGVGAPAWQSEYGGIDGLEVVSLNPGLPVTGTLDVLVQGLVWQDNAVTGSVQPVRIWNTRPANGALTNAPSAVPMLASG